MRGWPGSPKAAARGPECGRPPARASPGAAWPFSGDDSRSLHSLSRAFRHRADPPPGLDSFRPLESTVLATLIRSTHGLGSLWAWRAVPGHGAPQFPEVPSLSHRRLVSPRWQKGAPRLLRMRDAPGPWTEGSSRALEEPLGAGRFRARPGLQGALASIRHKAWSLPKTDCLGADLWALKPHCQF